MAEESQRQNNTFAASLLTHYRLCAELVVVIVQVTVSELDPSVLLLKVRGHCKESMTDSERRGVHVHRQSSHDCKKNEEINRKVYCTLWIDLDFCILVVVEIKTDFL